MVCFQSDYLYIEYHEPDKVLISQWYGTCSSRQYRKAMKEAMHYTKEFDVNYAIIDRRLIAPLPAEDLLWTREIFNKDFHKLPLKRFAVINAFNLEAEEQQQQIMNNNTLPLPFEMRNFEDLTSAYDWLTVGKA